MSNENSAKSATKTRPYDSEAFEAAYIVGVHGALRSFGISATPRRTLVIAGHLLEEVSEEQRKAMVETYPGPIKDYLTTSEEEQA